MEVKIYRLLGVEYYRRFLIAVKKKYDSIRGKEETENYFMQTFNMEGLMALKEQLEKNAKIHALGVLVCAPVLLNEKIGIILFGVFFMLHNAYCVMVQRYHLIRINKILKRKNMI